MEIKINEAKQEDPRWEVSWIQNQKTWIQSQWPCPGLQKAPPWCLPSLLSSCCWEMFLSPTSPSASSGAGGQRLTAQTTRALPLDFLCWTKRSWLSALCGGIWDPPMVLFPPRGSRSSVDRKWGVGSGWCTESLRDKNQNTQQLSSSNSIIPRPRSSVALAIVWVQEPFHSPHTWAHLMLDSLT